MIEYDTFYDEIKGDNNNLRITIPRKLADAAGYQPGQKVKILIQKVTEE